MKRWKKIVLAKRLQVSEPTPEMLELAEKALDKHLKQIEIENVAADEAAKLVDLPVPKKGGRPKKEVKVDEQT